MKPWREPRGHALVGHAVERMDARCRELLKLLFWETPSPSYDEAAARLGMPIGSLGPTRGRCLEKLRAALAELGVRMRRMLSTQVPEHRAAAYFRRASGLFRTRPST